MPRVRFCETNLTTSTISERWGHEGDLKIALKKNATADGFFKINFVIDLMIRLFVDSFNINYLVAGIHIPSLMISLFNERTTN